MDNQTTQTKENFELSVTDKIVGLFTEPSKLFTKLSDQKPKTSDWLIPLIILMFLSLSTQVLIMKNPALSQQAVQEQMKRVESYFNNAVEKGQISQEQAEQQLEAATDKMEQQMNTGLLISAITTIIFSFLFFFMVSGFFILIVKFGLKCEGTYKAGLTAYGLPGYILGLQLIVTIILMLAMTKIKIGTDAAKILGYNPQELTGYLLSYIDPFKIWFYTVIGIAFAKMFKSEKTGLYISTILGVWFFFGIAFWGLSQVIPFLKFMIR